MIFISYSLLMSKKIYLIDWNSFIYRMFFWLPEFSTKDGKIVNAIFGMAKFFVKQLKNENPDYLIFIKDARWENFRHKLYPEYKATRDKMPDNLRDQIGDIEKMIKLMWIDIVEIPWYEADDVIWTLATKLWSLPLGIKGVPEWGGIGKYNIEILTWDKDLYSLVSDNIKIYDTMKKKKFWPIETKEKFEIEANMITDYLAIVWDKSDNIPWIEWFWPKKAVVLINNLWWVEKIYDFLDNLPNKSNIINSWVEQLDKIFRWKTLEKLIKGRENAFLSKKLTTLNKNVELLNFTLEDYRFDKDNIINQEIINLFKLFEFNSLIWENETKKFQTWDDLKLEVNIIWNKKWLDNLKNIINNYDNLFIDTETTSLNIMDAELVWISIYLDDNNIFYINRLHTGESIFDKYLASFLDFLLTSEKLIVWHNLKFDLEILELFQQNKQYNIEKKFWQMSMWV